mgnify:CR=1 FL=1
MHSHAARLVLLLLLCATCCTGAVASLLPKSREVYGPLLPSYPMTNALSPLWFDSGTTNCTQDFYWPLQQGDGHQIVAFEYFFDKWCINHRVGVSTDLVEWRSLGVHTSYAEQLGTWITMEVFMTPLPPRLFIRVDAEDMGDTHSFPVRLRYIQSRRPKRAVPVSAPAALPAKKTTQPAQPKTGKLTTKARS